MAKPMYALIMLVLLSQPLVNQTGHAGNAWRLIDDRIGAIVDALSVLEDAGIDISNYTRVLNRALRLAEQGRVAEALGAIEDIYAAINETYRAASAEAMRASLLRYVAAIAVLLTPIAVYAALPRLYLYTWYLVRRGWLVEEVDEADATR